MQNIPVSFLGIPSICADRQHHNYALCQETRGRKIVSVLCEETICLWSWCILNQITPVALHLLSLQNTLADQDSRHSQTTKVFFQTSSCKTSFKFLEIELFAPGQNKKCQTFCSRRGSSPGSLIDAFPTPCTLRLIYAFPLTIMILRVLRKLRQESGYDSPSMGQAVLAFGSD